ncbi:MAG TPA: hypothetical protein VE860_13540 [Chthoniobacterales bacterium]|nr:hypothetical protein [Chthoniobacterales bacterium]
MKFDHEQFNNLYKSQLPPPVAMLQMIQGLRKFMHHPLLILLLSALPVSAAERWEELPPTPAPIHSERSGQANTNGIKSLSRRLADRFDHLLNALLITTAARSARARSILQYS